MTVLTFLPVINMLYLVCHIVSCIHEQKKLNILLNVCVKGENMKMIHPLGELHWICNYCNNLEGREALYAPHEYYWHNDF